MRHKSHGGLGVRQARLTNMAILGKLDWQLVNPSNKLWPDPLAKQYQFTGKWPKLSSCKSASHSRKAIVRIGNVFYPGIQLQLGNGMASFLFDAWLPVGPLCRLVPYLHILPFLRGAFGEIGIGNLISFTLHLVLMLFRLKGIFVFGCTMIPLTVRFD